LEQITTEEKDWLIEKKYIKLERGKYIDLIVTSRYKPSKRKGYYVSPDVYKKIKFKK